jgi:Na+-driven multidrug efflux pump
VIIQSAINSFGDPHITAGNGNAANIENFVYIAMSSLADATVSFVGQSVGAKNFKLVKKIFFTTLLLVGIVGLILGTGICIFREPIMELYSSNAQDVQVGMNRISILCMAFFICGLMNVGTCTIRGMGNSVVPMIIALIGACGMRIAWVYTVFRSWHTTTSLYISYPISWLVTFLALFTFATYYRKRLERKEIERQKTCLDKESE